MRIIISSGCQPGCQRLRVVDCSVRQHGDLLIAHHRHILVVQLACPRRLVIIAGAARGPTRSYSEYDELVRSVVALGGSGRTLASGSDTATWRSRLPGWA